MMALPSSRYGACEGRFDSTRAYTLYNAAGDVVEGGGVLPSDRVCELNDMTLGNCLAKAAEVDKTGLWYFAMVLKNSEQHVYSGTAAEASNGTGTRIVGIQSVSVWAGRVGRKRHEVARKRNDPPVSTHDRVRALHGEIQDLVCARTLTQSSEDPYRVPVSRGRVLNAFTDAMETFEALRSLPVNAPDRTDRRPCPPEE